MENNNLSINEDKEFENLLNCAIAIFIIKDLSESLNEKIQNKKNKIIAEINLFDLNFNFFKNELYYNNLLKSLDDYCDYLNKNLISYEKEIDNILEDKFDTEDLLNLINFFIAIEYKTDFQEFYLLELKKHFKELIEKYFEILKNMLLDFYEIETENFDEQEIKEFAHEYLIYNANLDCFLGKNSNKNNLNIAAVIKNLGYLENKNLFYILDSFCKKNYDFFINMIDNNLNVYSELESLFFNSSYESSINFTNNLGKNIILNNKLFKKLYKEGFFNPISKNNVKGLNIFDFNFIKNNKVEYINNYSIKRDCYILSIDMVIFVNNIPVVFFFEKEGSWRQTYENIMSYIDNFPGLFTLTQKIYIYDNTYILEGSLFDDIEDYTRVKSNVDEYFEINNFIKKIFDTNKNNTRKNKLDLKIILDSFLKENYKTITNIINYDINKFSQEDHIFYISTYEYASNFIYKIKKYDYTNKDSIFKNLFTNEDDIPNNDIRIIDEVDYSKNNIDLVINYEFEFFDTYINIDSILFVNYIPAVIFIETKDNPKNVLEKVKKINQKEIFKFIKHIIIKDGEKIYFGNIFEDIKGFKCVSDRLSFEFDLNTKTISEMKEILLGLILERDKNENLENNGNLLKNEYKDILNIKTDEELDSSEQENITDEYSDDFLDFLDEEDDLDLNEILDSEEFKNYVENADFNLNKSYVKNIIESGFEEDKKLLVLANEKLVYKYAKYYYHGYRPRCLDIDDLVELGQEGLLKAAERFDLNRDISFSTYAVYWIRQSISRGIQDVGDTVRIPVHLSEKINKLNILEKKSESIYGCINDDYILKNMGEKKEKLNEYRLIRHRFLKSPSLDVNVGEDGDTALIEFLEDTNIDIESEYEQKDLSNIIQKQLYRFSDRERFVINKRFGLDGSDPMTLEEIGNEFGVSRERIRQIESKAINKLKNNKIIKELKDYI
ncbi:RNA polymerase sigma factor RpoD [Peptoniphilus tyrrelliae]|nr:RNA polymerase sigma factor RpoD [Peptoniphilus tyrrelliae]